MLEKMGAFFDARLNGYEEHQLNCIEGAKEFYPYTASLLPMCENASILDLGCGTGLQLEGGCIINGAFAHADVIDEISIVLAPVAAYKDDKPLFTDSTKNAYRLTDSKIYENGAVWLSYKKE